MKLIVAGSTGFVGTEIIRQALSHPEVTSLIALGRREISVPENVGPNADTTKLKSVICDDFENYPQSAKQELAGADACIWTIAVTPAQLRAMGWEQACKICRDYAIKGIETITQLPRGDGEKKPFRWVYISGSSSVRDPAEKPWVLGDYCVMRGDVESKVLTYAKESKGTVEVCVAKPGMIDAPGKGGLLMNLVKTVGRTLIGLPKVDVGEISAALLDQVVNGFEKDTLQNEDLVRIGQEIIQGKAK
ncbi:uncharacterized protein GGS22DRAFT_136474 [Annulohypoxylon maeteangense]|uniref:uncharacterized protein n=1 Tax=Annulohypoxylon maeteangense TaxID=1927788 RepID=UPI0020078E6A|nr:uncharacterized protein GGS22DRAFT_136474 [Annulohypoxylon maeteangense]KAI0884956.1 hypothetical protein GGS22DRAFT_136474 [Annulohypoxylon maeteangense]